MFDPLLLPELSLDESELPELFEPELLPVLPELLLPLEPELLLESELSCMSDELLPELVEEPGVSLPPIAELPLTPKWE